MNKYRHLKPALEIEEGTVNLTYGVTFSDGTKCKSHSPSRPFVSLIKLNDDQILSLKMSTQNSEKFSDHKILVSDYGKNAVMSKSSYVATNYIYTLNSYDYIMKGFKLSEKDLAMLYNRIIRLYCINAGEITEEQAKIIFERYMKHKKVGVGAIIRIPYLKQRLFIYEKTDEGYKCLPIYKFEQEDSQDMLRIMRAPFYINYDEEIFVEKNDIFFIYQFTSENELIRLIQQRKYSMRRREEALFSKKFIKPTNKS